LEVAVMEIKFDFLGLCPMPVSSLGGWLYCEVRGVPMLASSSKMGVLRRWLAGFRRRKMIREAPWKSVGDR